MKTIPNFKEKKVLFFMNCQKICFFHKKNIEKNAYTSPKL